MINNAIDMKTGARWFRKNLGKISLLSIIFFFILTRVPFLNQPLIGEEGAHALIAVGYVGDGFARVDLNEPVSAFPKFIERCKLIDAHIDGVDYLNTPIRNLASYCILGNIAGRAIEPVKINLGSFGKKTIAARLVFLTMSLLGFISLALLCHSVTYESGYKYQSFAGLLLLISVSNHLLIGASIQPQLDGAFSFLLLGISVSLFYYSHTRFVCNRFNTACLLGVGGGFISSLCKNEWTVTLLFGILLLIILDVIRSIYLVRGSKLNLSRLINQNNILIVIGIGALLGALGSAIISPRSYLEGFDFILRMNARDDAGKWYSVLNTLRQPILWPLFILFLISSSLVAVNMMNLFNRHKAELLIYVWASLLMIGFLQSGYYGDGFLRYYCAPMILFIGFILTQALIFKKINQFILLGAGLTLAGISGICYERLLIAYLRDGISITVPDNYRDAKNKIIGLDGYAKENPNAVLVTHSSMRLYFPSVNFITRDVGIAGAEDFLSNKARQNMYLYFGE